MKMDLCTILVPLFVLVRTAQGSDLDYTVDILQDLDRSDSTHGITAVSGLHNESKAFLFRDVSRSLLLPPPLSSRLKHMFREKSDFTFLATVQQKSSTSGVLFSIHDSEHSWFELQSSGIREELVFRYSHRRQSRSEPLPYRLADGQWHRVALTVSTKHLQLHVDCNRIYERLIDPPQTDMPQRSEVWLGQQGHKHGLFKGLMQDVKFVFAPNGFVAQCPTLNRTCPTCSDFLSLVQGIMDLQDLLSKMTLKLSYAESRLSQLENCRCEKTCNVQGVSYRDTQRWAEPENCRTCVCKDGMVECRRVFCPLTNCSEDSLPVRKAGLCCRTCRPKCLFMGQTFGEGQRLLTRDCRECENGAMVEVPVSCPELNCSSSDQILPDGSCCKVCRGHDFCSEAENLCGPNSDCENLQTKAQCACRHGYAPVQGDHSHCEDVDECALQLHSCASDTVCENVPGGFDCVCPHGSECSTHCPHPGGDRLHGEEWTSGENPCRVCSCQDGRTRCRPCDCSPTLCDHSKGRCLDQNGTRLHGDTWVHQCQQCHCTSGQVQCDPGKCPRLGCSSTVLPQGECCPSCVSDPCMSSLSDPSTQLGSSAHSCKDYSGSQWLHGDTWTHETCSSCSCQDGNICCTVDLQCVEKKQNQD